jgi:hypothetical protein
MSLLKSIDLGTMNPDAVEESAKFQGLLPDGVYLAELVSTKKLPSDTEGYELTFEVLQPEMFRGSVVKDSVWEPKADNQKQKTRVLLIYHRLGLLAKVGEGKDKKYVPVEGKSEIPDAINGRFYINVNSREFEAKEGGKIKVNGLAFEAIIQPHDERVKKLGPAPAAAAGTNGTGNKKPDYSEL